MPAATPTSTAPPSPPRRSKRRIAVQALLTAVILAVIGFKFAKQWRQEWSDVRHVPFAIHPRWGMIVLASAIYLAGFAVLIETWRRMIVAWGERISFDDSARVWAYSNLVRYLPGNTFLQVPAFAELARRRQVSPAAAGGSAAVNTVVNIAVGFVIALGTGWQAINALSKGHAWIGIVLVLALAAGLAALPVLMPPLIALARRLTGRTLLSGALPARAIYISIAGNVVAWLLYGVAFQAFVIGVLGAAPGNALDYIALYSSAYVIGYVMFWLPAGLGARDGALADGLSMLHLAAPVPAGIVAVCARLWTTILELVPALIYFARATRRRPHAPRPDSRDGSLP